MVRNHCINKSIDIDQDGRDELVTGYANTGVIMMGV